MGITASSEVARHLTPGFEAETQPLEHFKLNCSHKF